MLKSVSVNKCVFLVACAILIIVQQQAVNAASTACSPPTLPPNSNFIASPNCTGTYTSSTSHCRCWGHCGYICEPRDTQTCQAKNANGPANKPPSFKWVPSPGCTYGQRPSQVLIGVNGDTNRCTCYAFCGYLCDPNGSTGAAAARR